MHGEKIETSSDEPKTSETTLRLIGIALFVVLYPIYAAFERHGQEAKGFLVVSVTIVFFAAAFAKRRSLLKARVAIFLALFYLIQLAIMMTLNVSPDFPGFFVIAIAFVDVALVLWGASLIERIT